MPPSHVETDTPLGSPLYSQYKLVQIWQDSINGILVTYAGGCYNTTNCILPEIVKYQSPVDLESHIAEISYSKKIYKIYFDNLLVYSSPETNISPRTLWFGNNSLQGPGDKWTNFSIDSISIENISISSSPLIFLPGMGGCWNGKALINGTNTDDWNLLQPAKWFVYNPFFESLGQAGLIENEDWYLFCYDWRKPIHTNAEKLAGFVNETIEADEKVDLVGHSMGGLISRAYSQDHSERINKTITLGSPHQGATQAYLAWEGGQIESSGLVKFLNEFLLKVNQKPNEHRLNTIRRLVPSLQDLLPTYDFLIDQKTGQFKNINTHQWQNQTLLGLNSALSPSLKSLFAFLVGTGYPTLESLTITSTTSPHANWYHQQIGLWEDGEPIHTCTGQICEYTDHGKDYSSAKVYTTNGDKTVLTKSASIADVETYTLNVDHQGLAQDQTTVQTTFDLLGLTINEEPQSPSPLERIIGFLVRSPAQITVTDPLGNRAGFNTTSPLIPNVHYDQENKFLLIPNPLPGQYLLTITGIGEGDYRLAIAGLDENDQFHFDEYQFPTQAGKINQYSLDLTNITTQLEDPGGQLTLANIESKLSSFWEKTPSACQSKNQKRLLFLIKRAILKSNYQQAKKLTKSLLTSINRCFWEQSDQTISQLLPELESLTTDLINLYILYDQNQPDKQQLKNLQRRINRQKNRLDRIDKRFQRKIKSAKEITLLETLVFEKASQSVADSQSAFEKGNFAETDILILQTSFYLFHLSN
ncbi:esterase/lipase family protein [Patescibacteria group bacterium]